MLGYNHSMSLFRAILFAVYDLAKLIRYMLSGAFYAAWHTLISGTLLLCISLLGVYLLIGQYPKPVSAWLSQVLQQHIQIEAIATDWQQNRPVLRLTQIKIAQTSETKPWLQLQTAVISIALLDSLLQRHIVTQRFLVEGLHLRLRQHSSGRVSLPETPTRIIEPRVETHTSGDYPRPTKLLAWLRLQQHIRVDNSRMMWLRHQQNALLFEQMQLNIKKIADKHSIRIGLQLPKQRAPLPFMQSTGLQAKGGKFTLFAQGRWHQQGHLIDLSGYSLLENIIFSNNAKRQLSLNKLSTNIELKHQLGVGWRLNLHHLRVNKDKEAWPRSQISLMALPTPGGMHLQGHIGFVRLQDLLTLLSPHIEPAPVREHIQALDPEAELHQTWFAIDPNYWQLNTHILNWRHQAYEKIPGLAFSDAYLHLEPGVGTLRLQSSRFEFDAPRLYPKGAFPEFKAEGKIAWRFADKAWQLDNQLQLSSAKIKHVDVKGFIKKQGKQAPVSDLHIQFEHASIDQVARYFPKFKAIKGVKKWLKRSLKTGHIRKAKVALVGELTPKHWLPKLSVKVDIEKATLAYAPKWPPLKALDAQLQIANKRLWIDAKQGKISQAKITQVQANIADLSQRNNHVDIKGKVQGKLEQGLDFIAQSPLAKALKLHDLQLEGKLDLDLGLKIPFQHGVKVKTQGHIHLKNTRLQHSSLERLGLEATELDGEIHFSEQQLSSKRLKGTIAGQTISAELKKQAGNPLQIDLQGLLNRPYLQQFLQSAWKYYPHIPAHYWQSLSGSSPWQLQLTLGKEDTQLQWQTDLQGITLDLPAPLTKTTSQTQKLNLNWQGDDWQGQWQTKANQFNLALDKQADFIRLGLNQVAPPLQQNRPHWSIQGQLSKLDLSPWQQWWQQQQRSSTVTEGITAKKIQPHITLDLQLAETHFAGQTWQGLQLTGQQQGARGHWSWSAEQSKGSAQLSAEQIRLDLEHLQLQSNTKTSNSETSPSQTPNKNWSKLPAIWFQCQDLSWNQRVLGNWLVVTEPAKHGVHLRGLKAQLDDNSEIKATGFWPDNSKQAHQLELELESHALGDLLKQWQIKAQGLNSEYSQFKFKGQWHDKYLPRHWQDLEGDIEVLVGKGVLEELEPGALARVLALVDLESLPKRLTLEFEDVAKQGFHFDEISGQLRLESGLLHSQDLHLKAIAADILINGHTDLKARQFAQEIKVIPHLNYGLPLTGVLLGGYGVGIVALLLQQIWQHSRDEAAMYLAYRLEGDWDNPILEAIEPQE